MADETPIEPSTPADKDKFGFGTVDVQRGIAWLIVGVFSLLLVAMATRVIVSGAPTDSLELLKQGVNALINIVMVVVGFFFGSSKSSQNKDESQSKIVEKLTSTAPPGASGPVAPLAEPTVVIAWWSLLTDGERAAINGARSDARVQSFVDRAQVGRAEGADLDYLVARGLLTAARATSIQTAK